MAKEIIWKANETQPNLIPFTQYLRPDGRRVHKYFTCPNERVVFEAQQLLDTGLTFACEELSTGQIVFYVTDDVNEEDKDMVITENNPKLVPDLVEMIHRNYERFCNGDENREETLV